jgi:pimeloyl-ACP methyl ester carboxylesterase
MQISQEYRMVTDGSSDYVVTTHRSEGAEPLAATPNLVIANGWIAGTPLYRRMAARLIDAAAGNLTVTTYNEPIVGSSAYGTAYKAERLDRTVRAMDWDQPVTLLGHSRGWLTAATAGEQLVKEGFVRSMIGLTPMGHGEMLDFDLKRALLGLGVETLRLPKTFSTMGSLVTASRVVGRGFLHLAGNPVVAYREINDIMCADASEETAALSHITPMQMISGEYDTAVPPDCLQRRLEAAGYQGSLAVVPTTHLGAMIDYKRTPEVYAAMQQVL